MQTTRSFKFTDNQQIVKILELKMFNSGIPFRETKHSNTMQALPNPYNYLMVDTKLTISKSD